MENIDKKVEEIEGKKRGGKSKAQVRVEKRYGTGCKECGIELNEHRLTGTYNGESMSFCSFNCMDLYKEKNPPIESK